MKITNQLALTLVLLSLFLTSCSSSGEFENNEQSFISGNGVATFIPIAKRDLAPRIVGPTLSGETFIEKRGSVRVLNVWASWCSPCRAEAPALEELSRKYQNVQFIGVLTRDSLPSARAFVERFKLTYPTIIDDAILLEFRGQLSPNAIPTTLIIDQQNRVAARVSGEITFSSLSKLIKRISNE
jgi:thiol-disulfide isomerase/thioredoxin